MTTSTSRRRLVALGVAVCTAVSTGACSGSSDKKADATSGVATTVVAEPGTTSAPSISRAPGTTGPPAGGAPDPGAVRDWDGSRFDFGTLDRIDRTEDGRTLVVLDRMQVETAQGRKSGKDLTTEPIVYANTDTPFANDNPALRTYVARPGIEVLRLANLRELCTEEGTSPPARWAPVTVDQVVSQSLWDEYPQVSLTFSTDGYVSRLRLSSGC